VSNLALCTINNNILNYWQEIVSSLHVKIFMPRTEPEMEELLTNEQIDLLLIQSDFVNDIKHVLQRNSHIKILLLEDIPAYEIGKDLLSYGLKGYGNSRLSKVHLLDAIKTIQNNKIWLYPEFIQDMIKDIAKSPSDKNKDKFDLLTHKQKEVALLVSDGLTNKEIATKISTTEATVKVHLRTIFEKMEVTDRLSLALALR
jgi:DNA-binding NarL/FixJ family response regulator